MRTIGLTGPYCSGKNEYAKVFAELGCPVIDVDALGHEVLDQASAQVIARFGADIVAADGSIDRKRLGAVVFGNSSLADLEAILHPLMKQKCLQEIEKFRSQGACAVVLNAALLHRMRLDVLCDVVCFVHACTLVRYLRSRRRDGSTLCSFIRRMQSQKDIKPALVDGNPDVYVMSNGGSLGIIHRQVRALCATIGVCRDGSAE